VKPCKLCGVDMDTWGKLHNCRPPAVSPPAVKADVAPSVTHNTDMANSKLANASRVANAGSATYRYRDIEKRRTYQREVMRKVRAKEKMASPA